MSEILLEENSIILASATKMLALGTEASKRMVAGKESKEQDEKGASILTLLTAYRQKSNLGEKQLESLLYCLRGLAEENVYPTINPIVGQLLTYVTSTSSGSGGGTVSLVGVLIDRGNYNASTNFFPAAPLGSGTGGAILRGNLWRVSVSGVLGGVTVEVGAILRALVDDPGQNLVNWIITY